MISADLEYVRHKRAKDIIQIYVKSSRREGKYPYCGTISKQVHSHYERHFRGLPIQGKKVEVVLDNLKYFCKKAECGHKTFAEVFDCLPFKAKRSRRLTESIIELSLNVSSVKASEILKKGTADIGKSTICTLLNKGR